MHSKRDIARTLSNISETIAVGCKISFSLKTIDRFFIQSGCDPSWWTPDGYFKSDSERYNRACGWFAGIRRHSPQQEIPILIDVCQRMLADPDLEYTVRKQLEIILTQLGGDRSYSPTLDGYHFDQRVLAASGKLFTDGHYKAAAREAFVALIDAVRVKSGTTASQDKDAMTQAFRANGGLLQTSSDPDEQQGYQFLFAGAVSVIRNPLSHIAGPAIDQQEALECLAFASLLYRYLDRSEKR